MVKYDVIFSKLAGKDKKMLKQAGLEKKAKELLDILLEDPYEIPPPYEKLRGNLSRMFFKEN